MVSVESPKLGDDAALRRAPNLTGSSSSRHWLGAYGLTLMALIVVHYLLLFAAIIGIVKLICHTGFSVYEGDTATLGIVVIVVATAYLVRMIRYVRQTVVGLVTHQYDREAEAEIGIMLDGNQHRGLYQLVHDVGKHVGTPLPIKVSVTGQAECYSIELRRFGLRSNRQFILVLGLPHLEVLSVGELQVIVAHELAHFSAGDTRVGVFAFRFLESLRRALRGRANRWLRWFDPLCWYTFLYLHGFLLLTIPLRRYQEDSADRMSAAIFGGDLAVRTLLKDWFLVEQFEALAQQRLADHQEVPSRNIFHEFATHWHELSAAGNDYLERRLCQTDRVSYWDSHPAVQQRISAMRDYPPQSSGEPYPARQLLSGLEDLEEQLDACLLPRDSSATEVA